MILPASSPKKLRSVSEKRLVLYGVAAGAALAAGVSPAEAGLITLDLTGLLSPTRTTPVSGSLFFDVNAASAAAAVGFAPFAGADFEVYNTQSKLKAGAFINGVLPNNSIAVGGSESNKAARLTGSNSVGSANNFSPNAKIGEDFIPAPFPFGNFGPGDTGYLGLRFDIGGNTHYGWANITLNGNYTVALNTLGYESVAGASAHVPASVPEQGNSLVLLAIGAAGIAGFRAIQRKAA